MAVKQTVYSDIQPTVLKDFKVRRERLWAVVVVLAWLVICMLGTPLSYEVFRFPVNSNLNYL